MKESILRIVTPLVCVLITISLAINVTFFAITKKTNNENETPPPVDISVDKYTKEEFLLDLTYKDPDYELELPIIEINTENEVFPYDKVDYINCSFKMSNTPNGDYDIEKEMQESAKSSGGVGIRLRGNSTMQLPKKPFRIKFNEKTSLMGLTANKSWALLADYNANGAARMLNYSALTLSSWLDNLDYSATPNHVVVFVNDDFQGLYLLTEHIEANKGRVPVKEDFEVDTSDEAPEFQEFPFLIEGFALTAEEKTFDVAPGVAIEVKYPDFEDYNEEEINVIQSYIEDYMAAVWKTVKTGHNVMLGGVSVGLTDLVDIDSLVDLYLLNEIMENAEGMSRSVYMHKTTTGKLKFGPAWDFDIQFEGCAIGTAGKELLCCQYSDFMREIMKHEEVYQAVVDRYQEIMPLIDDLYELLINYQSKIDKVAKIDSQVWYGDAKLYNYGYDLVKARLMDRKFILAEKFSLSHDEFVEMLAETPPYIW